MSIDIIATVTFEVLLPEVISEFDDRASSNWFWWKELGAHTHFIIHCRTWDRLGSQHIHSISETKRFNEPLILWKRKRQTCSHEWVRTILLNWMYALSNSLKVQKRRRRRAIHHESSILDVLAGNIPSTRKFCIVWGVTERLISLPDCIRNYHEESMSNIHEGKGSTSHSFCKIPQTPECAIVVMYSYLCMHFTSASVREHRSTAHLFVCNINSIAGRSWVWQMDIWHSTFRK